MRTTATWCSTAGLLSLLALGCGNTSPDQASSTTAPPARVAARPLGPGPAPASGLRLSGFSEDIETPTGKIGSKLSVEGPAAARLMKNPGQTGARNLITFIVFPQGTDPARVCESSSPGPAKKNQYLLSVTGEYDGDLKAGPMKSASSPSIATVARSDDGDVSSTAIGKPGFVTLDIDSVSADAVTVKVGSKPGGGYTVEGFVTARMCK